MHSMVTTSAVVVALLFGGSTSYAVTQAPHTALAQAESTPPAKPAFSRGRALQACRAEARAKNFGYRFLSRSRFIRSCIERRRAAQ